MNRARRHPQRRPRIHRKRLRGPLRQRERRWSASRPLGWMLAAPEQFLLGLFGGFRPALGDEFIRGIAAASRDRGGFGLYLPQAMQMAVQAQFAVLEPCGDDVTLLQAH